MTQISTGEEINVPLLGREPKKAVYIGGAVLGAVVVYALYKRNQASAASPVQTTSAQIQGDGQYPGNYMGGGNSGSGGGYYGGGGGGSAVPPGPPTGPTSTPIASGGGPSTGVPSSPMTAGGQSVAQLNSQGNVGGLGYPTQAPAGQQWDQLGTVNNGTYQGQQVAGGAPVYFQVPGQTSWSQGYGSYGSMSGLPSGTKVATPSTFQNWTY